MVPKKVKRDAREKIMLNRKTMTRTFPAQPKTRERESRQPEHMIAREQAHREELKRIHRQYAERIRQAEAACLGTKGSSSDRKPCMPISSSNIEEKPSSILPSCWRPKTLLLQATEVGAMGEKRLVQLELQRDSLRWNAGLCMTRFKRCARSTRPRAR